MHSYSPRAIKLAEKVEKFVRETIVPYEADKRCKAHGPTEELVKEMRAKAKDAELLTPHILEGGSHLSQLETALVLKKSGLSPLGPVALNTGAPDEGNMFLLGKVASPEQKERFLKPLVSGGARSAFFMTEPALEGGAGSDPSMLKTTAKLDGNHWIINGRKTFITGAVGAKVGIIMAMTIEGASLFLVDLPDSAVKINRILDTIDNSMPGGHAEISIENLRLPVSQMLGQAGEGFRLAQVRLAPARLSHCMRWHGLATRAQEIALDYACRRNAFGKKIIDHEGIGFKLAENQMDLKQSELVIDWCAAALDRGERGNVESSIAKVTVSESLSRVADNCVQIMGGMGVSGDTIVEQFYREIRAFRIYDGATEVHKWSLAKKLKREWEKSQKTEV
jgi:acyl-CoA dehydrogenase